MTLFLKKGTVLHGLYFERRLRNSHSIPFFLDGEDTNMALDVFLAYWIKARNFEAVQDKIIIDSYAVAKERAELFKSVYI